MNVQTQFPSFSSTWRQILRQNFTQWEALADFLELDADQRQIILTKSHFPLNLPRRLAEKITKHTLNDPILHQFLPTIMEKEISPDFFTDPVGDCAAQETPKLLHKYQGRALLVCSGACAMHCRYCFRQNYSYDSDHHYSKEIQLISEDPTIHEVLLSGGDPLSLSDRILQELTQELGAIPHVKRIRFHTRFPIGIPERLDEPFLALLAKIPCQVLFVIHANHPIELDEEVLQRIKSLQYLGVNILHQAVLLRHVNDDIDTLTSLFEKLVDNGIMPYYLHQLDRVQGAAHFEVAESVGLRLMSELGKRLPGYAIPRYVREIAGEASKTLLV